MILFLYMTLHPHSRHRTGSLALIVLLEAQSAANRMGVSVRVVGHRGGASAPSERKAWCARWRRGDVPAQLYSTSWTGWRMYPGPPWAWLIVKAEVAICGG